MPGDADLAYLGMRTDCRWATARKQWACKLRVEKGFWRVVIAGKLEIPGTTARKLTVSEKLQSTVKGFILESGQTFW